ncbi:hypothetical protein ABJZ09_16690, partial [Vibrio parahaemolyticus]
KVSDGLLVDINVVKLVTAGYPQTVCVRVENADQLAELLFKTQGLEERLEKKRESARSSTTSVPLGERIPVHIIYQTAWLEEGTLYYRDDIYKYDHQG